MCAIRVPSGVTRPAGPRRHGQHWRPHRDDRRQRDDDRGQVSRHRGPLPKDGREPLAALFRGRPAEGAIKDRTLRRSNRPFIGPLKSFVVQPFRDVGPTGRAPYCHVGNLGPVPRHRSYARAAVVVRRSLVVGRTLKGLLALVVAGELVQTTAGKWITHLPTACPNGRALGPGQVLAGHQACFGHGGGHTPHGPAAAHAIRRCTARSLNTHCTVLDGPAAVRISTTRG
jgi:hypothetical protein